MLYSTRSKLIFSFLSVALLVGVVSLIVGWQLLYDSVLNEANNRVRQDLNVARVIYDDRITAIRLSLETTGLATDFNKAVKARNQVMLKTRMDRLSQRLDLDFAGIITADGTRPCPKGGNSAAMAPIPGNMPIADAALQQRRTVSGTVVLDQAMLEAENLDLANGSPFLPLTRPAREVNALPQAGETAGVALAIVLGCLPANRIMRPVNQLIHASMEISTGNFSPDIGPVYQSDIGLLQKEFKNMTHALVRRDQQHQQESEKRLIQSEKQASIGKLAAGVAHEINNPLTAVLSFTHLILRRKDTPKEARQDLETIAIQTERVRKIVKGLPDFSRQSRLDTEPLNLGRLLEESIHLMENQALISGRKNERTHVGDRR